MNSNNLKLMGFKSGSMDEGSESQKCVHHCENLLQSEINKESKDSTSHEDASLDTGSLEENCENSTVLCGDKGNMVPNSKSEHKIKTEPAEETPGGFENGENYSDNKRGHVHNMESNYQGNIKTAAEKENHEPDVFDKNWLSYEIKHETRDYPNNDVNTNSETYNMSPQSSNDANDWSSDNIFSNDPSPSNSGVSHSQTQPSFEIVPANNICNNMDSSSESENDNDQKSINSASSKFTNTVFTNQSKKASHPCKICGQLLAQLLHFKKDMANHSGEISFQCAACHNSFPLNSPLNQQIMTHSEEMSTKSTKMRTSYTAAHKLVVCKYAEEFGNRAAGRKFDIDEKNIRRWRQLSEVLKSMPSKKKALRGGKPSWPNLEDKLCCWANELRAQGHEISTAALRLKAKEIAEEMQILNFQASNSWAHRFKRRDSLARRQIHIAKNLPDELEEKAMQTQQFILNQRGEHNYPLSKIGNADQTPLTFDTLHCSTTSEKG